MVKIGFTGHRPNKLYGYDYSDERYDKLERTIVTIINNIMAQNPIEEEYKFYSGGALGVDTIAFYIVEEFKHQNFNVKNILAIPFYKQDYKWPIKARDTYKEMKELADEIIYVDTIDKYKVPNTIEGEYNSKKLLKRNECIDDNIDILIACCNDLKSGTGNCIKTFKKKYPDKKVIIVNPITYKIELI